jgi:hypothetical protein
LSGEAAVCEDALNSGYGPVLPRLLPADLAGYPRSRSERRLFSLEAARLAVSTEAATPVKTFPTDLALADVMLTKMTSSPR